MSEPRWIKLFTGRYACVSDEDYETLSQFAWYESKKGYPTTGIYLGKYGEKYRTKQVFMHRMIMGDTKGLYVDHMNRDPLDNRRENLRVATHSQNLVNRKFYKGKTDIGVYKNDPKKENSHWYFHVSLNGKTHKGFGFKTKEEAMQARNKKAIELYGEFARLNEVPQC